MPPGLIGHIHEHLGTLPGLGVFVGDGMIGLIMAEVAEVQAHRLVNGNLPAGYAQGIHQRQGVTVGMVCGAEAGHGNAGDMRAGQPHQIHGPARGQQCQGGIQPAGNAHGYFAAGDTQAAGQGRGLQVKDLRAARLPGGLCPRG